FRILQKRFLLGRIWIWIRLWLGLRLLRKEQRAQKSHRHHACRGGNRPSGQVARAWLLLLPACRRLRHTLAGFFQSHFILCWSLLPLCRLLWLTLGGRFLGIERGAELLHRLKPPPGTDPQAAEQSPLLLIAEGSPQLLRRDQLVLTYAVASFGRCLTGDES